ncbi:sensor histidine kinase [Lachnobacterium bovis]|uniref:histidine kinase n=1 Tax=Lachnobacterium bovis TaxID=140626 RepID=A0A1H9SP28_9FIRM|nr:HAMP domain-containing sensor histidine kinase [Lachnobacterium bovis]SER86752.1 Signal transduction histidine kinase [Lachnobacterium bovis]
MKVRKKLTVAFLLMVIVPITLVFVVTSIYTYVQIKDLSEKFEMDKAPDVYDTITYFEKYMTKDYEFAKKNINENVDKIGKKEYLNQVNAKLRKDNSFLVIKKRSKIVYVGKKDVDNVLDIVSKNDVDNSAVYLATLIRGEKKYLIRQIIKEKFDEGIISVYVVTELNASVPQRADMMMTTFISMLFIFIVTAILVTSWIYVSFVYPIEKTREVAESIKDGNLDYEAKYFKEKDDEIAKLNDALDQIRKKLKANAQDKVNDEKENRALISNIAHDLKTPITAVKGYAEGIIDGVANSPEKVEKYIKTIYNKANDMDALINELTLYSKIDNNRIPYNFAKLNVKEYYNDCIEEISLDLENRGMGLAYYNYADDDAVIVADPEQLNRVINNIVGNSVKYMDKASGFLNIRVKDVGDFIQTEIEDNGKGIAQKDLPYVFDRFYRADASRNSATGGSGIGLSIVKKIVEDHGGRIWVISKEGYGTTMYFIIRKYQEVQDE